MLELFPGVCGGPSSSMSIINVTKYHGVCAGGTYSLIKVSITSGRRHQIRIHLAGMGHPVCGDPLYRKLSECPTRPYNPHDPVARLLKEECK